MLRSLDGMQIHFRVMPKTLLHKVFWAYAAKGSLELSNLKFMFEGARLCPHDTVQESKIEDGDVIDALSFMLGD